MISLIIPFYNAAKDLSRCLNSVKTALQATPAAVEVLFVDDGSTDDSAELVEQAICEWNERGENRAYLRRTANGGRSAARNFGISLSTTAYIGFLDADDCIAADYFTVLLEEIQSAAAVGVPDIIEFNSTRFLVRDGTDHIISSITREIATRDVIRKECDIEKFEGIFAKGHWFVCFRLYARKLFSEIEFPIGVNYEDIATVPKLFFSADVILQIPKILMSYQINPAGITESPSGKDPSSLISIAGEYLQAIETSPGYPRKKLSLCVVVSALNSLFHVQQKLKGRLLGLIAFRVQVITLFSTYKNARQLPALYSLSCDTMREAVFYPELIFLRRIFLKVKR